MISFVSGLLTTVTAEPSSENWLQFSWFSNLLAALNAAFLFAGLRAAIPRKSPNKFKIARILFKAHLLVMAKLRVLCLHGYRQNGTVFRERTGAMRKLLKRYVDFVFISAPHIIPNEENRHRPPEQQERGWWFSKSEKTYNALDKTDVCLGFEESVQAVKEAFDAEGPFDGLLGFSQGACLAALLCIMQQTTSFPKFKFVILVSGFRSLLSPHAHFYKEPISFPSFHTIGATDDVISAQASEDLFTCFLGALSYRHQGGHYIPASLELRTALQEFLLPFLEG